MVDGGLKLITRLSSLLICGKSLTLQKKKKKKKKSGSAKIHYENMPIQIYRKFHLKKKQKKKQKQMEIINSDSFHISTRGIDCGYSLKPPRRGGSNEYQQSMFLSRNKK